MEEKGSFCLGDDVRSIKEGIIVDLRLKFFLGKVGTLNRQYLTDLIHSKTCQ